MPSSHLDPQRIEEHQGVERFQRPVLPLRHLLVHRVGDRADQLGRDFDATQIRIQPAKTADQPRLRAGRLRVDFLARPCTA
jgi:hypothetical protein